MGYVYRHVRLDKNEVFYVGLSLLDDPQYKRAYSRGDRRNQHWKNIINTTPYRVDIIMDDLTVEETYEKEKEFIALYGRRDLGLGTLVNFTDGGDGTLGYVRSEEQKKAISERMRGENNPMFGGNFSEEHKEKLKIARSKTTHSEETLEKMRIANLGEKNPNYGKRTSEETKEKLRLANKGRSVSEEHKEKLSIAGKGRILSEEQKERLRLLNVGRKHTQEAKDKKSKSSIDKPMAYSKLVLNKYTGIIYDSVSQAFRYSGLKCKIRHFYKMLEGDKVNTTPFTFI